MDVYTTRQGRGLTIAWRNRGAILLGHRTHEMPMFGLGDDGPYVLCWDVTLTRKVLLLDWDSVVIGGMNANAGLRLILPVKRDQGDLRLWRSMKSVD